VGSLAAHSLPFSSAGPFRTPSAAALSNASRPPLAASPTPPPNPVGFADRPKMDSLAAIRLSGRFRLQIPPCFALGRSETGISSEPSKFPTSLAVRRFRSSPTPPADRTFRFAEKHSSALPLRSPSGGKWCASFRLSHRLPPAAGVPPLRTCRGLPWTAARLSPPLDSHPSAQVAERSPQHVALGRAPALDAPSLAWRSVIIQPR
jgi:hypothetical protein